MIKCTINGRNAIPSLKDKVKLTKENPFVKSSGSYTYDVIFPLAILDNVRVFGAVHRLDVSKEVKTYEDCALYAGNRLIIRGKGTVTSITDSEVRLQIISGDSASAYNIESESVFIDRMVYPEIAAKYLEDRPEVADELESKRFIGEEGKYIFQLTHIAGGETTGPNANSGYVNAVAKVDGSVCLTRMAVQPSLLFVMKWVLKNMGYTPDLSAFDRKPWSDLYIANVTITKEIRWALPHWKAGTLLDEFRKLFNAVFFFDEEAKTVKAVPYTENSLAETVALEVIDEFESNFDEDGLEYLGASNIAYSLSENHEDCVDLSRVILKHFQTLDFANQRELNNWITENGERKRMTTFFRLQTPLVSLVNLNYYRREELENRIRYSLIQAGVFRPLLRDMDSDTTVEFRIVPVAMTGSEADQHYEFYTFTSMGDAAIGTRETLDHIIVPIVDEREEDDEYVSVCEAVEEDAELEEDNTEESGIMEVMFATSPYTYNQVQGISGVPLLPKAATALYQYGSNSFASLTLNPVDGVQSVGDFHKTSIKTANDKTVDGNDEMIFKFLYDGIPDPMKKYNIHNKLYLCSKIEISITPEGDIDRLMTGYFYEIL